MSARPSRSRIVQAGIFSATLGPLAPIQIEDVDMAPTFQPVGVPMPEWTDEELRTLVDFRRRNGHRWKSKLLDLYLFGKDDSEPDGAKLRWIRNRQGPSRVDALRKADLDAAEARLCPAR